MNTSLRNSHWRALACDLDGTLLGPDHKILDPDRDALHRARAAGFHVAICTGRTTLESAGAIAALDLAGPGIFVNGAMVADVATGKTLHARFLPENLADEVLDFFGSRGHAVLILVDDAASRLPLYFMSDHGPPHRSTVDWLMVNRVHSTLCNEIPPQHRRHLVRLGIIVNTPEAAEIEAALHATFTNRVAAHSIRSPYYDCQVIELFTAGTSKWSGIETLAQLLPCSPDQVIAIGDDVNDIAMLQNARLSFAMANAKTEIQAFAKRITAAQSHCGVAQIINALLTGHLEPP